MAWRKAPGKVYLPWFGEDEVFARSQLTDAQIAGLGGLREDSPELAATRESARILLECIMHRLPERHAAVLRLRMGLVEGDDNDSDGRTRHEVAEMFRITVVRVMQIEQTALRHLGEWAAQMKHARSGESVRDLALDLMRELRRLREQCT